MPKNKPEEWQWKQESRERAQEREWQPREDTGNNGRHQIPPWYETIEGRKRFCTLTEKRKEKKRSVYLYVYLYVYVCARKRERVSSTATWHSSRSGFCGEGKMGKAEMNLLWFCDNNGNDGATKNCGRLCVEKKKRLFLFILFLSIFFIYYIWWWKFYLIIVLTIIRSWNHIHRWLLAHVFITSLSYN